MSEVVLSIIVVGVFLTILLVLFLLTARRVNSVAKKNFVDKLQQYDFLIDEKEKKVDQLNNDILKKEELYKEIEVKVDKIAEAEKEAKKKIEPKANAPQIVDLEDGDILEKYKEIKTKFDLNVVKTLKKFLKEHEKSDEDIKTYNKYVRLRIYFGFKTIYKISTYKNDEQVEIIKQLVKEDEWGMVEELMSGYKKFNINKLVEKIDSKIIDYDPKIYVYVAKDKKDYKFLDDRIVTKHDDKITEGIKVVYKGIVYDYSI